MLSFTTVAFAAVGGFLAAQLSGKFGLPLWAAFPAAALGGGFAAAVVAFRNLRLEGHWMALASLALILITRVTVLNAPASPAGSTA